MSRPMLIKIVKIKYKEKVLNATKERQQVIYESILIKFSDDLFAETLKVGREWYDIFKVRKWKNLQPRILYPARLSFIFIREIKIFTGRKAKRVEQYQTIFTAVAKVTSQGGKETSNLKQLSTYIDC